MKDSGEREKMKVLSVEITKKSGRGEKREPHTELEGLKEWN